MLLRDILKVPLKIPRDIAQRQIWHRKPCGAASHMAVVNDGCAGIPAFGSERSSRKALPSTETLSRRRCLIGMQSRVPLLPRMPLTSTSTLNRHISVSNEPILMKFGWHVHTDSEHAECLKVNSVTWHLMCFSWIIMLSISMNQCVFNLNPTSWGLLGPHAY
jgi:hypothetical protein